MEALSTTCARLGLNECFADEAARVLRPFHRVSLSLRHAALLAVADRHSIYLGSDEAPTRAVDVKRVRLSAFLLPQEPRDPCKYVRRLLSRLARDELYHDVCHILERMQHYAPHMPLLDRVAAAVVVADEDVDLPHLARALSLTEGTIARVTAHALTLPVHMVRALLTPAPAPPTPRTPTPPDVVPTEFLPPTRP